MYRIWKVMFMSACRLCVGGRLEVMRPGRGLPWPVRRIKQTWSCTESMGEAIWVPNVYYIASSPYRELAKRAHIVAATLLMWSGFPSVDSFWHTCNICGGHKFCVLDTKNVSENHRKHFLCLRGAQQCCLILPQTGNIAEYNVAATMCPRFAGA